MGKLRRSENVHIPSVADLPPEAAAEREILEPQGIRSLIVVPLVFGVDLMGFLGFDSVRVAKTWADDDISLLRIVGEIIVNGLERKRAEDALRRSEESIRALYNIASSTSIDFTAKIQALLAMGSRHFGLEIGLLSRIEEERYEVIAAHTPDGAIAAGAVFDLGQTYCRDTLLRAAPLGSSMLASRPGRATRVTPPFIWRPTWARQ